MATGNVMIEISLDYPPSLDGTQPNDVRMFRSGYVRLAAAEERGYLGKGG